MYSLDCNYYKKEFNSIDELINESNLKAYDGD